MDSRKKAAMVQTSPHTAIPIYERCTCKSLKLLSSSHEQMQGTHEEDEEQFVPISEELHQVLRSHLTMYCPHMQPLSVLLLHLSQREHTHIIPRTMPAYKRHHYHAPPGVLEQVLTNVRRAIRGDDIVLIHENVGAALIFLDVDQQGAYNILERIYNNVSLLQAETIVPPLRRETSVLLGIGTTSETDTSLELVCSRAGSVARAFHLRPAITPSLWYERADTLADIVPFPTALPKRATNTHEAAMESKQAPSKVPFMALPVELPSRLKNLIPYKVALQIRCVPVGRNHHCLTVAMSNPNNTNDIQRLAELTGMTIFPIACDEDALDALLDKPW